MWRKWGKIAHPHMIPGGPSPLERLRRYLALILFLALLGTGSELLLVGHTEKGWQWVPVILIPAAILLLAGLMATARGSIVRIWQALMLVFILSGGLGLGLHWKGKIEFKQESDPSLRGMKLFWEALHSESPPPLAPGVMIQMGLLGLAYAYRHPAFAVLSKDLSEDKGDDE